MRMKKPEKFLTCLGFSHRSTPWSILERVAVPKCNVLSALAGLREYTKGSTVILSTCNRTEVLSSNASEDKLSDWFRTFFTSLVPSHSSLHEINQSMCARRGTQVIDYLLRVCCGLDSAIVGEPEILGQVKEAYRTSLEHGFTDPILNQLFERSFSAAKYIRTISGIGCSSLSYASIALRLAKNIFADLAAKKMLVIGAGKMMENVIRHFVSVGVKHLTVTNRSPGRGAAVASQFHTVTLPFKRMLSVLHEFDIVVCCTGSKTPLINECDAKNIVQQRKHSPMLMVDFSLPRNISTHVKKFEDIFFYDIEDLSELGRAHLGKRHQASQQAEVLIAQNVHDIVLSLRLRAENGNLLKKYRRYLDKQRWEVLERAMRKLDNGVDAKKVMAEMSSLLSHRVGHTMTLLIADAVKHSRYKVLHMIEEMIEGDLD